MTFKRLVFTFWGASCLAGTVVAADVPSLLLKLQVNVNLDTIAEQTHGSLQWRNGAFVYKDKTSMPVFHTLDRTGRLLSSVKLEIPGTSQLLGGPFDHGADGTIVFSGEAYSSYGQGAPLLAWISPDGHTERVIRTAPYYTQMLGIAPDGTLWTVGYEMINHKMEAPELDPQAGIVRHFDKSGKLIGSFFPQSKYANKSRPVWLEADNLVVKKDRLAWYAPSWGGRGRYTEVLLDSMTMHIYRGILPELSKESRISEVALTDDGVASVSVTEVSLPQRLYYTFDRTSETWVRATLEAGVSPFARLIGSDGDQLVFTNGHWAGFLNATH